MKNRFLTTFLSILSVMCVLSSTTSCVNLHVFDQADKNTTGVLCIGMENSKKFGHCAGSQVDATRMFKVLSRYSKDATLLISQQATKSAVVSKMVQVCQKDLAIIYYSGHGGDQSQTSATKANFTEPTGKDQFLCLYDNKVLDDEIWAVVSNAKGRVVMIFDCCHSATMFRTPIDFKSETNELFGIGKEEEERGNAKTPNLLCISGCPDNTVSYGGADGGLLTNAILSYFKESMTYNKLWKLLHNDYQLNSQENVQFTEIGKEFKDYLIFR